MEKTRAILLAAFLAIMLVAVCAQVEGMMESPHVSIDSRSPKVGETVTITPLADSVLSLTIIHGSDRYKFLGTPEESISYTPQEPGKYTIEVVLDNGTESSTSFTAIATPAVSLAESSGTSRRADLVIGESGAGNRRDVEIFPRDGPVKSVRLRGLRLEDELVLPLGAVRDVARHRIEGRIPARVYAIDPSGIDFANGTITATAIGTELWKCKEWEFRTETCHGTWTKIADIRPGEEYGVEIGPLDPGFAETGLASINTKKSIYTPNEKAELVAVVLDREGFLVGGADVNVTVSTPDDKNHLLTATDGEVRETSKGIYEASFEKTSLIGEYLIAVRAVGNGVESDLASFFIVSDSHPFDILRETPVTTDPWLGPFASSVTIVSRGHQGTFSFTESLPENLTVTSAPGAVVVSSGNMIHLEWSGLSNGSRISYEVQPPLSSPELFLIGPSTVRYGQEEFNEARAWYLAIDPASPYDPSSDIQTGWNDGTGITHLEIDDGSRYPTVPNTNDYLSDRANDNVISEFGFPPITQQGITSIRMWVYTGTASNAQYSWEFRQGGTTVCSYPVGTGHTSNWTSCAWTDPSGDLTDLRLHLGGVTKSGGGPPQNSFVYAAYIEVQYDNPPIVELNQPLDGAESRSSRIDFNFTPTDDADTILADCSLYTNTSGVWAADRVVFNVANGTETNISLSGMPEGPFLWNIFCRDQSGQGAFAPANRSVLMNGVPPIIQEAQVNDTEIAQGESVRFNASITDFWDIDTGIVELLAPNGQRTNHTLARSGNEFSTIFSGTNLQGTYSVTLVQANDSLGQIAQNDSTGIAFSVVASPPAPFDLVAPGTGTVSGDLQPVLEWAATSDDTFDNYTIQIDRDAGFGSVDFEYYNINSPTNNTRLVDFALDSNSIHYWRVIAHDTFGNTRQSTSTFTYVTDTLAPAVVLNEPVNGTIVPDTPQRFNITATDENAIAGCTLYMNVSGVWQPVVSNSSAESGMDTILSTSIADGVYLWNVLCSDGAGNEAFAGTNRTATIDTHGPTISLITPPNGTEESGTNNILFGIVASDAHAGAQECDLLINGVLEQTKSVGDGQQANFTQFLSNGQYNWSAACRDAGGISNSSGEYRLSVDVVDSNSPLITVHNPVGGAYLNESIVRFNYTVEDATGIENCSIYIDGVLNETDEDVTNFARNLFTIGPMPDGSHPWSITCFDNSTEFNPSSSQARDLFIDTVPPPPFSLESPPNGTIIKRDWVVLEWGSSEDTNFRNYTVFLDDAEDFTSPLTYSVNSSQTTNITVSGLQDGVYRWRIVASDLAGNSRQSSETWNVHIHSGGPQFTSTDERPQSPATYSVLQEYNFSVLLEELALDSTWIEHNFTGIFKNESPTGISTTDNRTYSLEHLVAGLAAGTYRLAWHANDTQGQEGGSGAIQYVVLRASPILALSLDGTEGNHTTDEGSSISIAAEVSDPPNGYLELYIDGSRISTGTGTITEILPFDAPGEYNITATYNQTQNHTEGGVTWFLNVQDITSPTVSLLSPENDSVSTSPVTFQYSVTDESSIENCSLYINNTLNQTNATPLTGTGSFVQYLEEKDYSWYVLCLDTAGNSGRGETRILSVGETDEMLVSSTTNRTTYESGSDVEIRTTTEDGFGNPVAANVTLDIIREGTASPWWDTRWKKRKAILLNETSGMNVSDGIIIANVTGLGGSIDECREIRIVRNESAMTTESPYEVYGGDNSSWCTVAFRGNVTGGATNEVYYYAYYNNSAAQGAAYDFTTRKDLIFNALTAGADEGTPIGTANIAGKDDATAAAMTVTGGGAQQESAHGRAFIDETAGKIFSVRARYRYAVPTMQTGTWYLRRSVDDGATYSNSFTGAGTAGKTTSQWDEITSLYAGLNWTELNRTRLQARVTKEGGSQTATIELYWVEMNVTARELPNITQTAVGAEERWVQRTAGTGEGDWSFLWDSTGFSLGNYSVASEASAELFGNETGYVSFEIVPDQTPPNVTLISPQDREEQGVGEKEFTFNAQEINLDNCTLYLGKDGTFEIEQTRTDVLAGQPETFTALPLDLGVYLWNVFCQDSWGNGAFAQQNFTLNITGPDLFIERVWSDEIILIEGSNITLSANVTNRGLSNASEQFKVKFSLGDPAAGGTQIGQDILIDGLEVNQIVSVSVNHTLVAGDNAVFATVDVDDTINESDEGNNEEMQIFVVSLYQTYYGNISAGIILGTNRTDEFYAFGNQSERSGHVLVADADSSFGFGNLVALTRTESANPTADDFTNSDASLGTSTFSDSIKAVWGGGTDVPEQTSTIDLSTGEVQDVPYVNSTNTSSFRTGILWDSSDDASANDQYDTTDREDLVFVANINQSKAGKYGTYDYEIKVPRSLKGYTGTEDKVAFYYEII